MSAYYNEFEPYAAQWLRNLIAAGLIAPGDVDERSIVDVAADDLVGYRQCHFFAGIGGWALAARLAGWPDDRELWTGSPPCQPFSVAGKQEGFDDSRDLWPVFAALIRERRPATVMGEQVSAAIAKHWLDRMRTDLEAAGYTVGASVQPACAVDGPHRRDRLWIVGDADSSPAGRIAGGVLGSQGGVERRLRSEFDGSEDAGAGCVLADTDQPSASEERQQLGGQLGGAGVDPGACNGVRADADRRSAWGRHAWIIGHDGKARRVEPGIRLLAHGVPARVGRLRAYGNAIVPQVAAEVIAAYMECRP